VLIAFGNQALPNPLAILRLGLGLIYVLYIPGYTFQLLLFPRAMDFDNTERLALSFILSVVVLSPIALVLNWLPWGIRLWPVVISLTLFNLACMIGTTIRRLRIPDGGSIEPTTRLDLRTWWTRQARPNRVVYVILIIALTTASLTAFSILVMPKPAERFTEFYILGTEGLAESYPREIAAGQTITITTGITNREDSTSIYQVLVLNGDKVIGQAGPFVLINDQTFEQPISFTVSTIGDDQQIKFLLEREGQPSPYRSLRLWINVRQPESP